MQRTGSKGAPKLRKSFLILEDLVSEALFLEVVGEDGLDEKSLPVASGLVEPEPLWSDHNVQLLTDKEQRKKERKKGEYPGLSWRTD